MTYSILRDENGGVLAYRRGATFVASDMRSVNRSEMREYVFSWDDADGELGRATEHIHAPSPEVAFKVFEDNYRIKEVEYLHVVERIVTFREIPIPEIV